MAKRIVFSNPPSVHPPLGPYSHVARIAPDSELVFLSGQIGNRHDGTVGTTIAAQAEQAFSNVCRLLESEALRVSDVVKLSVFIVAGQDAGPVKAARLKYFGAHRPTSTTLYVAGLLSPDWLIEIEATAVRETEARVETRAVS